MAAKLLLVAALSALLPAQDPAVTGLMERCTEALAACERALAADDGAARTAAAAVFGNELVALRAVKPRVRPEFADEVSIHVDGIALAAAELAQSERSKTAHEQSLASLRRACTSCHLQFRDDNERRGLHPAQGAVLAGRIEVRRADDPKAAGGRAVVFLEGALPAPRLSAMPPTIVQQGRAFVPSLLSVPVGTTVAFPNRDTVFHNVFSVSKVQPFDLGLYGGGEQKQVAFAQPGLVKVFCNIHPEMIAHILVLPTDLAAVTTPAGFFCIEGAPAGKLVARVWTELGDEQERPVELVAGSAAEVAVTVVETKQRLPHRNKAGRPYREKY